MEIGWLEVALLLIMAPILAVVFVYVSRISFILIAFTLGCVICIKESILNIFKGNK